MLTLTDISLQFAGDLLYKHVDLIFQPNHCYGIIGANGTGKSTFLKVLSGELEPTTGEVVMLRIKASPSMPTVFEKLLSGEWTCANVYEDELVFAFMSNQSKQEWGVRNWLDQMASVVTSCGC